MSKILILAEKPDIARTLANHFNATQRTGYFEGGKYVVTYAFGHLFELYDCVDYDPSMEKWELDNFPFIPSNFKYKLKNDPGIIKQFKTIKELSNRNDIEYIVNATDNDREAELLSTIILGATGTTKPIKRILSDEWTDDDITNAFNNIKDNSEMIPLQNAGSARQLADWIIGINFTTVATLCYGNDMTLNIGRVIAPTTYLVYERDMLIKNFKSMPYFQLKAILKSGKGQYEGLYIDTDNNTKFEDKSYLENIINSINNKPGIIVSKTEKESKSGPEKLFNLINLQGYITSKYDNWTSDKVLNILQKLYEGKGYGGFTTYPRTSSRYLTTSKIGQTEKVLNSLIENHPLKDLAKFKDTKDIFDDSKVESHGAIIPTYVIPNLNDLTDDEKILYNEIKLRFISQFMPKAEFELTEIITKFDNYSFITKGKILKSLGWMELYEKEFKDTLIPNVKENSIAEVQYLQILDKKTEPPNHYTEESLLSVMENCGKDISEDNIESILAGYRIGTPATSSATLTKIQDIGYVKKKGKSLYITDLGVNLVETLPIKELFDIDFTGKLEKNLKDIENGNLSKNDFLNYIINFTKEAVLKMKNSDGSIGFNTPLGKCPECDNDVIEKSNTFNCINKECKFTIWKNDKLLSKFNIKLTSKLLKDLLSGNKIIFYNLKSDKGNFFDAELNLIKNTEGYWNFNFNFDFERDIVGICPDCKNNVVETGRGFQCINRDCNFILWRNDKYLAKFNKTMTKSIAKQLLSKKEATINNLTTSKGKANAKLGLYKNTNGYWSYSIKYI